MDRIHWLKDVYRQKAQCIKELDSMNAEMKIYNLVKLV